jgi:hypothetical protein
VPELKLLSGKQKNHANPAKYSTKQISRLNLIRYLAYLDFWELVEMFGSVKRPIFELFWITPELLLTFFVGMKSEIKVMSLSGQ